MTAVMVHWSMGNQKYKLTTQDIWDFPQNHSSAETSTHIQYLILLALKVIFNFINIKHWCSFIFRINLI